jgi:hypothetical protein
VRNALTNKAFYNLIFIHRPLKWALSYDDDSSLTAYYRLRCRPVVAIAIFATAYINSLQCFEIMFLLSAKCLASCDHNSFLHRIMDQDFMSHFFVSVVLTI